MDTSSGVQVAMKLVYLPLDDRPMSTGWVRRACTLLPVPVVVPSKDEIGTRYRPADFGRTSGWLNSVVTADDVLVLSMDTLLNGGLVHGRTSTVSSDRLDGTLQLMRNLKSKVGRNGKILGFYIWKRLWGNLFKEEEIAKVSELQKISLKIAEGIRSGNRDYANYIRLLSRGAGLEDWMDKSLIMDFARYRLRLRKEVLTLLELRRNELDFLHIAREDNDGKGITPYELQSISDEAKRMGLTFSSSEGGDEAGMLLICYAVANYLKRPIQELTLEIKDRGNLQKTPHYEGAILEQTLKRMIQIAKISTNPPARVGSFLNIILDGTIEWGDPLLSIKNEMESIPSMDKLLSEIKPAKRILRFSIVANLTAINGVNFRLVEWLASEETLPLCVVQSGTIANRIGYVFFLGTVLRYGLERKVPEPGVWTNLSRVIIATYLEEVVFCGYLRTWAMKKFGGIEPGDAGVQALAEVEMSNFLREFARMKFNGAEFLERKIEILDVRLRLPWDRWFECEVEVHVQPR